MTHDQNSHEALQQKLEALQRQQRLLGQDLDRLSLEISALKNQSSNQNIEEITSIKSENQANTAWFKDLKPQESSTEPPVFDNLLNPETNSEKSAKSVFELDDLPPSSGDSPKKEAWHWEKFVGENLINKIGIAITVIGLGIGVKYSIDHNLISPVARVILAYIFGLGLLGVGLKLKKNYASYSAVLVGGAMASLYFVSYFAYDFYGLMPKMLAFGLMLLFTIGTVTAALRYQLQSLAHIALVGAYAVPFLLSDHSGQAATLFTYMAIINLGILILAFKKSWASLYYSSFGLTWLVLLLWYAWQYDFSKDFAIATGFASVFFLLFHVMLMAYQCRKLSQIKPWHLAFISANALIYYGLACAFFSDLANSHTISAGLAFALALCFGLQGYWQQSKQKESLFYHYLLAMALLFVGIGIPIMWDNEVVTLMFAALALVFFWLGCRHKTVFYHYLSYPLMAAAFYSLSLDWEMIYDTLYSSKPVSKFWPMLNVHYLSSLLVAAAFAYIHRLAQQHKTEQKLPSMLLYVAPGIALWALYQGTYLEIKYYFELADQRNLVNDRTSDQNIRSYQDVWLMIYSLVFWNIVAYINLHKLKNQALAYVGTGALLLSIGAFLSMGLEDLADLRLNFLSSNANTPMWGGYHHLYLRYFGAFLVLMGLWLIKKQLLAGYFDKIQRQISQRIFDSLWHISLLFLLSAEVIHVMCLSDNADTYQLFLSILWGVYALWLIVLGIWKKQQHLRLGAILLLIIALGKVFFCDLSEFSSIAKTMVLVVLGILLLIISFLYNKYKHLMEEGA